MRHALSKCLAGVAAVALVAFVVPNAEAQSGKITGVVTDAESGVPLSGVEISLVGTGLSALTASNGRYFLINVLPSTYIVRARRIGYQIAEVHNVIVQIDVTKDVSFALSPAAAAVVEEIRVEVEETPLIQPGTTGSGTNIQAEEIRALPVTNIQGVLSLQQGFFEVPSNTDIISFTDRRRQALNPVRIRGGRAGETLTLLDQIPINNFVFGGPAFNITTEAIEQVDFVRGGFEPQYGNALSGIINIATREGGTNLAGSFNYQTSAVGGALGADQDELRDFDLFQGYVSGPVPATSNRIRFMVAGRSTRGAEAVLNFDDDINRFSNPRGGFNLPHRLDLFPGWRAFGYDEIRDVTGKLTFYVSPTAKFSFTALNYERQRERFDFWFILSGFNPLEAPGIANFEDSLRISGGEITTAGTASQSASFGPATSYQDIVQGSIRVERELYAGKWDHTLGRWAYKIAGAYFKQRRNTCNFFMGVCMGDRFSDINFTGIFVAPGISVTHPARGTDEFFGGEDLETKVIRTDIQGQATDHHAVQLGLFYQRHDLEFKEFRNQGVNDVFSAPQLYRDKPWDAAFYFQDKIEYDFLTVKLGARFDFGKAGGVFFANPRDPTNGTTARQVCLGEFNSPAPFTFTDASGVTHSGFDACALNRTLLDSAATLSQIDDFTESSRRNQFSPRIGVSFPLSERSQVFFNFGRYSQNPLYNNVYGNTAIGTLAGSSAEGGDDFCAAGDTVPTVAGSSGSAGQCLPGIFSDVYRNSLLGNSNLLIEKTTAYELGFLTQIADDYSLQVVAFSKDQFGLTGIRRGGRDSTGQSTFDVGATYGTGTFDYSVLINQDFQTVRGFELQLRRRLTSYWGYRINYGFSEATTNAASPDLQFQLEDEEGEPVNNKEIKSNIDQPHVFNASLFFRVGNERPFGNSLLDAVVRNSNITVTVRAASGLPFTPTLDFTGFGSNQLELNSGRGPSTFRVDAVAGKDFQGGNVRYGVFVRVVNLLNTQNCYQVFASTGRCDAGTIDQSRREHGNPVGENTVSTLFDRPSFFTNTVNTTGQRQINAGLRMNF